MTKRPDSAEERIDRLCKMIGLAKRASRLQCGTEMCCEAVRAGKARLVLLAENVSENTKKKVQNCCTYYRSACQMLPIDADRLSHAVGNSMSLAAVAVTDDGFAQAITALLVDPSQSDISTKPQEV